MSPTPNSGSGKKLVQARLSFQLRPSTNENEPARKKLALAPPANVDDSENVDNTNAIPNSCEPELINVDDECYPRKICLTEVKNGADVHGGKRKGDDECIDLEMEPTKKQKIDDKARNSILKLRKFQIKVVPSPKNRFFHAEHSPKLKDESPPEVVVLSENNVDVSQSCDKDEPIKNPEVVVLSENNVDVAQSFDKDEPIKNSEVVVLTENNVDVAQSCDKDEPIKNPEVCDVDNASREDLYLSQSEGEEDSEKSSENIVVEDGSKKDELITISDDVNVKPNKKVKKITHKQLEKRIEFEKKREERMKLKQEILAKKQLEKEEKQKMKEERQLQKRKELEEREEIKQRAKEEKERKRQQEIELKNLEKKRKEEDAQKKRESDALAKENKFAKEAAVFTNFFYKDQKSRKSDVIVDTPNEKVLFKPFAVKSCMRMAPMNRNPLTCARRSALDELLINQSVHETYLTQLRCGDIEPGRSSNTWTNHQLFQDDDIEVEESQLEIIECKMVETSARGPRPKLIQFHENRRPPYWGTWRKKCPAIRPCNPFGTYQEFDYDVDSDEEWEEEEPGESLHGSDDEKEKDEDNEEDNYEVDNDFFVPHGYLSEDEAPDEHWSVEQQKEKLKLLGEQFDKERNEKTRQLRPVVIGCVWSGPGAASDANPKIIALLERCRPWLGDELTYPISLCVRAGDESELAEGEESSPSTVRRGVVFPDDAIPELIARIHGSTISRKAIAKAFSSHWATKNPQSAVLTLASVSRKVRDLATWMECPEPQFLGRYCWYVSPQVREEHGCGDLVMPTRERNEDDDAAFESPATPKITKFTKVLSEEERRKNLQVKTSANNTPDSLNTQPDMTPTTPSPVVEKTKMKLNRFKAPSLPLPPKPADEPPKPVKRRVALFTLPPAKSVCSTTEDVPEKIVSPDSNAPKENPTSEISEDA